MAAPDLTVFQRFNTLTDYQQLQDEFELKKLAAMKSATGQDPASVKLANEIQKARAAGDTQRINDLMIAAKSWDKGVVTDAYGNPVAMGGYGDAVGSIAGTTKAYEANAQNLSDLQYDPLIAGGEAQQRQAAELTYADPIAQARKAGELAATAAGEVNKKGSSAVNSLGLTAQARKILQGNPNEMGLPTTAQPTGSYGGAAINLGKRVIGISDPKTKANTALEVIAGNLTAQVPRFEGPQSDADRRYYMQMAGKIDDVTVPAADKLAALDEMDRISQKYAQRAGMSVNPDDMDYSQFPTVSGDQLQGYAPGNTAPPPPPVELPPELAMKARKAPDGNFYVEDPNRPGKYVKVNK